jgi:exosome complex RNA-binding protein Rrp42 (RNase PH superfamily)
MKYFFYVNSTLCRSGIIPLSSLCIHPGKSVWVLYVDATCINYDGNAFDATLIAMVAALKNGTFGPLIRKFCIEDGFFSATTEGDI